MEVSQQCDFGAPNASVCKMSSSAAVAHGALRRALAAQLVSARSVATPSPSSALRVGPPPALWPRNRLSGARFSRPLAPWPSNLWPWPASPAASGGQCQPVAVHRAKSLDKPGEARYDVSAMRLGGGGLTPPLIASVVERRCLRCTH